MRGQGFGCDAPNAPGSPASPRESALLRLVSFLGLFDAERCDVLAEHPREEERYRELRLFAEVPGR